VALLSQGRKCRDSLTPRPGVAVRRETRRQFALLVPFGILLAAYLFYRHYLFGVWGLPPITFLSCAFLRKPSRVVLIHYVTLLLVPWNLHSHRLILHMSHVWALSLLGWTCLLLWAWRKPERSPMAFSFPLFGFSSITPPALAMVHGGFMLDHWGYWIAPAVLLPLGILFDQLWARRGQSFLRKIGPPLFSAPHRLRSFDATEY